MSYRGCKGEVSGERKSVYRSEVDGWVERAEGFPSGDRC